VTDQLLNLRLLARRYLCIPATSAACERVFSVAGLIVDDKRTRLASWNVEDLVFLREYLNQFDN
jgi:hypothetical protein